MLILNHDVDFCGSNFSISLIASRLPNIISFTNSGRFRHCCQPSHQTDSQRYEGFRYHDTLLGLLQACLRMEREQPHQSSSKKLHAGWKNNTRCRNWNRMQKRRTAIIVHVFWPTKLANKRYSILWIRSCFIQGNWRLQQMLLLYASRVPR